MLAGAGSTANQSASIAGSTAGQYANADATYQKAIMDNNKGSFLEQIGGSMASQAGGALSQGAGTAGAAALFSDIRLKTNIVKVSESNGYNIYTWDWIEGHDYGYNTGVIAQEVLEKNPSAVSMMDNGYYAVDYSALGV